jgi:hypothetical protein
VTHVMLDQVAVYLALNRHIQHRRRDITPDPKVAVLRQLLPRQPRPTPDIQDVARPAYVRTP